MHGVPGGVPGGQTGTPGAGGTPGTAGTHGTGGGQFTPGMHGTGGRPGTCGTFGRPGTGTFGTAGFDDDADGGAGAATSRLARIVAASRSAVTRRLTKSPLIAR